MKAKEICSFSQAIMERIRTIDHGDGDHPDVLVFKTAAGGV
jgi:hypothetical protein